VSSRAFASAASQIPNRIFPETAELDPAPQVLVAVVATELVDMKVVPATDTAALVVVMEDTATEAHHLADTMMTTTVVAIVPHLELAPQSMTTRLPAAVVSMILIAATTLLLTRMSMAMDDHLHETTHPETILPEMLDMLIMIVAATDRFLFSKYVQYENMNEALR